MKSFFTLPVTVLALFTGSVAVAQPAGEPASEPQRDNLIQLTSDIQIKLVQELYGLAPEQAAKLHADVPALIPEQKAHETRIDLTLRRLSLARSFVEKDQNLSPEERAGRLATFERQYHELTAKGPLSLAAIIRRTESMLPPERLAKAKADIAVKLADRLQGQTTVTPETLHALFSGPMPTAEVPEVRRPTPPPPPPVTAATPPPPVTTPPTTTTPPPPPPVTTPPPPVVRQPVPPPAPKVFKPAPPLAEWPAFVDQTTAKINYTNEQKSLATGILESCRKRAEDHLSQHKSEYDAAAQVADPAAKTEKLALLNKRLDALYDELTQRVTSLATVEQKQKAGIVDPPPPPRPPPAVTPPAAPPQLAAPKSQVSQEPTARSAPPPAAQRPPQPVAPPAPRVLKPAPPEAEWAAAVDQAAGKFGFTTEQKKLADSILESCQSRAATHRQLRQADYEAAAKNPDAAKKSEETGKLNDRLNVLYDELIQRVESLATAEQKIKAGEPTAPATTTPPLPAKPTPAGASGVH